LKHDNYTRHPFQTLLFLIRDWDYEHQFKLGFEGGKKYLEEYVFKIKKVHAPDMKELRKFIKGSYESIECFLMPHPGETVAGTKDYDGRWSLIDEKFVEQLKKLITSILAPENLIVKKIAGEEVTAESLYYNMQFYLELFKSKLLPNPQSIYEATVRKFLQDMVSRYVSQYKKAISKGSDTVTTHRDFNILHLDSKKMAIDSYNKERKIGKDFLIIYYRNQLIDQIEESLAQQNQTMFYKIETKETNRKIRAQENETLRQEMEIQDLKRKQEEDKEKSEEAQKQNQENVGKLDKQNEKIQGLTNTIDDLKAEIRENKKTENKNIALFSEIQSLKAEIRKYVETENKAIAIDNKIQSLTNTINNLKSEIHKNVEAENKRIANLINIPRKAYLKQGNCFLCAQNSTYWFGQRKTDCCKNKTSASIWFIEKSENELIHIQSQPYNIHETYTIVNKEYNNYLYDAQGEPYHSTLAVWYSKDQIPNFRFWKIFRATNNDFYIQSIRGNYINKDYMQDVAGKWEFIDLA
jgi:hypothetical protein